MISLKYLFETHLKGYRGSVKNLRDPIILHIFYIIISSKTTIRRDYWKTELYNIIIPIINKEIVTIRVKKLSKEGYLKEFDINKTLSENYKTKILFFTKKAIEHNKDIKDPLYKNSSKIPFDELKDKLYMFFDELATHLANGDLTRDIISKMIDNIILKGLAHNIQ